MEVHVWSPSYFCVPAASMVELEHVPKAFQQLTDKQSAQRFVSLGPPAIHSSSCLDLTSQHKVVHVYAGSQHQQLCEHVLVHVFQQQTICGCNGRRLRSRIMAGIHDTLQEGCKCKNHSTSLHTNQMQRLQSETDCNGIIWNIWSHVHCTYRHVMA